jgi:hypothetical protein
VMKAAPLPVNLSIATLAATWLVKERVCRKIV